MDLTQGTFQEKNARAKKMMLWFAMVSIAMMFAGLTSAYVVSKSRPDWLKEFEIPQAFFLSTIAILLSSLTFYLAKKNVQRSKNSAATTFLVLTLILGVVFVAFQFMGFSQIIEKGYYFTGSESTVTTSFLYAIVFSHVVHVIAGLLVLITVTVNHLRNKYTGGSMLGLELGEMFWHFLDFLWLYLILFFYFYR